MISILFEQPTRTTAVQLPLHKEANHVRADQSTYQTMYVYLVYVYTCMLRPVCFPGAWSSWQLRVACLHLGSSTTSVIRTHFSKSERSGRNRPLREAPCTYAYTLLASRRTAVLHWYILRSMYAWYPSTGTWYVRTITHRHENKRASTALRPARRFKRYCWLV